MQMDYRSGGGSKLPPIHTTISKIFKLWRYLNIFGYQQQQQQTSERRKKEEKTFLKLFCGFGGGMSALLSRKCRRRALRIRGVSGAGAVAGGTKNGLNY